MAEAPASGTPVAVPAPASADEQKLAFGFRMLSLWMSCTVDSLEQLNAGKEKLFPSTMADVDSLKRLGDSKTESPIFSGSAVMCCYALGMDKLLSKSDLPAMSSLPKTFDWRKEFDLPGTFDDLGEEIDQGECGDCYSFVSATAFK